MKIVAVVPMKLNNKRLPQKNTKLFTNGKPLCAYILETLKQIKQIDDIYVYCSSPEIKQFLPEYVNYLKRPSSMDTDETKMNEILYEFACRVSADIYVMTHTTAPFIRAESIEKGLEKIINEKYDSAFAAEKLQDFLWEDGKPLNYSLTAIPRTQDLPILYEETSGFYIYKEDVILKKKRRIGDYPAVIEVGKIEGIDIDEEEDFYLADAIYNYKTFIKK